MTVGAGDGNKGKGSLFEGAAEDAEAEGVVKIQLLLPSAALAADTSLHEGGIIPSRSLGMVHRVQPATRCTNFSHTFCVFMHPVSFQTRKRGGCPVPLALKNIRQITKSISVWLTAF